MILPNVRQVRLMVKIRKVPQTGLRVEARKETPHRVVVRAGGRTLRLDMPRLLGGTNRGMMPLEALLAAYAGSLNEVGHFVAKTMDFDLRDWRFTVSAQLDPRGMYGLARVRNAFPRLHVEAQVTTGESLRRLALLRRQLTERCPVHNLLKNAGVRLRHTWKRIVPQRRVARARV
ncbi:MAG: OsmC family protein [Acidobacteria bacterium]|nr:OsmC family protein [Acidobacteriota bacterium]